MTIDRAGMAGQFALDVKGNAELQRAARQNSPEALRAAATQFEALFMNMVMKSMRDATPKEGMFDSEQSRMYMSMLDQQLSQTMASRGVGLADVLVRQLSNNRSVQGMPADPAAASEGAALPDTAAGDTDAPLLQRLRREGQAATQAAQSPRTRTTEAQEWQPRAPQEIQAARNPYAARPAASATSATGAARQLQPAASINARAAQQGQNVARTDLRSDWRPANPSRPAHVQAFQDKLGTHAAEASRATGIPAKFMLGQAALESGWGKREIVGADGARSHNLFGMKAGAGWKGKTIDAVTTEYVNGAPQRRTEKFRAYDSYGDAFRDYANMLRNNPRYEKVLANSRDAAGFAHGLQRAGYATDPRYADKLTRIISRTFT